jgi:osmotically-inducible protein OsmY
MLTSTLCPPRTSQNGSSALRDRHLLLLLTGVEALMKLNVCATVAATVCVGWACHRGTDTQGSLRKALDQANMPQVTVKVDDGEHIVHLKGIVNSMVDRSRAQEVADAVVGTSGRVLNELTVEGLNDKTAGNLDGEIKHNLDKMIDNDSTLKQRDINFDVVNGMVAIKGSVRSADEKNRVSDITKAAPGVKDVANGLEIEAAQ